jgi:hypothetical protein
MIVQLRWKQSVRHIKRERGGEREKERKRERKKERKKPENTKRTGNYTIPLSTC